MKLDSHHRLSPSVMLATLALVVASWGTAIAAESLSQGSDKPIAKPTGTTAVQAELARHATIAVGKPRRPDGSLVTHLGR
jgi:hypothetical protein